MEKYVLEHEMLYLVLFLDGHFTQKSVFPASNSISVKLIYY